MKLAKTIEATITAEHQVAIMTKVLGSSRVQALNLDPHVARTLADEIKQMADKADQAALEEIK